jgi:hypothetical protein
MKIDSVKTYYNNNYRNQLTYKAHIKPADLKSVTKVNNIAKVGVLGVLSSMIAKFLGINNDNNIEVSGTVNIFKENIGDDFIYKNPLEVLDLLKDKPDLLAKWFLQTDRLRVNCFGVRPSVEVANKMHKALKSQADVLYEIYMTPTHGSYDRYNGKYVNETPTSRFSREKSYVNMVLNNIIDLASNSDLSPQRSLKLLRTYETDAENNKKLSNVFKDLIKYFELTLNEKTKSDNTSQFICAKGVETHLHTDAEIDEMWNKEYRFGDD